MSSENIINLTKDMFEEEVINSNIPVLVDFWADWCGPCKMIAPSIDKIAQTYATRLKVCKVNVDEEGVLSAEHMIMSIPTIVLFKNGSVAAKIVGVKTYDELCAAIDKLF